MHELQLLDAYVEGEQQRLSHLIDQGGSWDARFRQKRCLRSARQAAAWARTRTMGYDAFVLKHGVLQEGALTAVTTFVGLGFTGIADGIGAAMISCMLGGFVGVLLGISTWDRSEAKLAAALATIVASEESRVS